MPNGERAGRGLDLQDRLDIERGIARGYSMAEVARRLGVSTSTVTREVRANRCPPTPRRRSPRPAACANACVCSRGARGTAACGEGCPRWLPAPCERLDSAPFCCNACAELPGCDRGRLVYDACEAQRPSDLRRSESRRGLSVTPEQLDAMNELVAPLIRKGWSPAAVWSVHGPELPVCERTYYNYVRAGAAGVAAIELPRAVRLRPRRHPGARVPRASLEGRQFCDCMALPPADRARAWQMDTVEGRRGEPRALLSLALPATRLQLYRLLERKDQDEVAAALDGLEAACGGPGGFRSCFPAILADRGCEFVSPGRVELSASGGGTRCSVFYCDPNRPDRKGACERNHAELRRILPKGSSLAGLTQGDVSLAASHLNSYPRESLGYLSPIEASAGLVPPGVLEVWGVGPVPPDEVVMSPSLLSHVEGIAPKGGRRR